MYLQKQSRALEEGAVLTALSSPHDREVIAQAQDGPISAKRILDETDIPKSTLYRRINKLEETGLLRVVDTTVEQGRPMDRYVCPLRDIHLNIQDGSLSLEWDIREGFRTESYA